MSRNFELLQNLGKEQDVFQADLLEVTAVPLPPPAPLLDVKPAPLMLPMDEGQKDEMAKLVQRLFLVPGMDAPRVVVVSGTESGSGCSWVCARMAEMLASQVSASVCVVDANLGAPGLHTQFQTENIHGLSDALHDPESIRRFARPMGRENLWLITSGSDSADRPALISSDRMRMRIQELRQEFHYVLIDAPAINTANDGIVLGRVAEGVVVVIKANSSRRETARKAIQELESAKVRVLGAVLNQRTFPIPQGIYDRL
jgi:capsular exopolysaccharide synthesis family protein